MAGAVTAAAAGAGDTAAQPPRTPSRPAVIGPLAAAVAGPDGRAALAGLRPLLADRRLAVLDMETTGLRISRHRHPDGPLDRPTRIALLPFRGGRRLPGVLAFRMDPGLPIHPDASAITGLRDADVAGLPGWPGRLPGLIAAIGTDPVVAHNAAFDLAALRDMLDTVTDPARAGELPPGTDPRPLRADLAALGARDGRWTPPGGVIDTLALARAVHGPARHPDGTPAREAADPADDRLATLAAHYRIPHRNPHDAVSDAAATIGVMHALLDLAAARGTVVDLRPHAPPQTPPSPAASAVPLPPAAHRRSL